MQFDESRMGGVETLVRPAEIPASIGPGSPATPMPSKRVRILEVNLKETQRDKTKLYDAGAWILTLDCSARFSPDFPAEATVVPILPVRAIVTIGTGGSSQSFECDVRNQSFQLPGAYVAVDLDWDLKIPLNATNGALYTWSVPDVVKVKAQIQRGFTDSKATRTMYGDLVNPADAGDVVEIFKDALVPNFARCARVWGERYDSGDFVLTNLEPFFAPLGAGTGRLSFSSDRIENLIYSSLPLIEYAGSNLLNPSGVPVPTLAQFFSMSYGGGVSPPPVGPIEFTLGL